jgi:hypothetical protein
MNHIQDCFIIAFLGLFPNLRRVHVDLHSRSSYSLDSLLVYLGTLDRLREVAIGLGSYDYTSWHTRLEVNLLRDSIDMNSTGKRPRYSLAAMDLTPTEVCHAVKYTSGGDLGCVKLEGGEPLESYEEYEKLIHTLSASYDKIESLDLLQGAWERRAFPAGPYCLLQFTALTSLKILSRLVESCTEALGTSDPWVQLLPRTLQRLTLVNDMKPHLLFKLPEAVISGGLHRLVYVKVEVFLREVSGGQPLVDAMKRAGVQFETQDFAEFAGTRLKRRRV